MPKCNECNEEMQYMIKNEYFCANQNCNQFGVIK